jgi:hypothetical protein
VCRLALALDRDRIQCHCAAIAGQGLLHGDRVGRRELIGQRGPGEQAAQGILDRRRSGDAGCGEVAYDGAVDGDLQARLASEERERPGQRLRRNVEAGGTGRGPSVGEAAVAGAIATKSAIAAADGKNRAARLRLTFVNLVLMPGAPLLAIVGIP